MALSPEERERVRTHLGYTSTAPVSSIAFGVPRGGESLYMVESAMNNLLVVAEGRVRETLGRLDTTLDRINGAEERLAARSIGEIETNPDEIKMLWRSYRSWQEQLANVLGVYPNRFDQRMMGGTSTIRVIS